MSDRIAIAHVIARMSAEQAAKRIRTDSGGSFTNQVAIVTGGASGIGKGIVHMLAKEGVKVAIFDVVQPNIDSTVKELKDIGHDISARLVDVAEESSVQEGMQSVVDSYGRLDIVVNCAGIVGPNGVKTEDVTVQDFDHVYKGRNMQFYDINDSVLSLLFTVLEPVEFDNGDPNCGLRALWDHNC